MLRKKKNPKSPSSCSLRWRTPSLRQQGAPSTCPAETPTLGAANNPWMRLWPNCSHSRTSYQVTHLGGDQGKEHTCLPQGKEQWCPRTCFRSRASSLTFTQSAVKPSVTAYTFGGRSGDSWAASRESSRPSLFPGDVPAARRKASQASGSHTREPLAFFISL